MYKHFEKDPKGEEKKLTDEEIVKSLECCAVEPCEDCGNCPRFTKEKLCHKANAKQSLDLIHRLQNDITEKDIELERARNAINERDEWYAEQKAENERLTEENERLDKLLGEKRMDELNTAKKIIAQNCVLNEENAELQKQVDVLKAEKENLYFLNKNLEDYIDNHEPIWKRNTEQAVKDTAKEILITAIQLSDMCESFYEFQNRLIDLIEVNYGVEIVQETIISAKGVEVE